MLEFTEDDLFRCPAVLEEAMEPGMPFHGHFFGVAPEFSDKRIGGLHMRHGFHTSCERSPWRVDGSAQHCSTMLRCITGWVTVWLLDMLDTIPDRKSVV